MAEHSAPKVEKHELTVGQEIALAEVIGGLHPWPTVTETHTYTKRVVLTAPLVASSLDELPTDLGYRIEDLPEPIVERTERLAWPWEFPDAF